MSDDELDRLRATAEDAVKSVQDVSNASVAALGGQPWSPWLVLTLTFLVLIFSLVVLHYIRSMLRDLKEGQSPGDVLRLATMPMVIAAAILLVLLGFSNEQITAVIGLLGTMVGYVLGSATLKSSRSLRPSDGSPSAGAEL